MCSYKLQHNILNAILDACVLQGQERGEVIKCVEEILQGNFSEEMTFKLNFKRKSEIFQRVSAVNDILCQQN